MSTPRHQARIVALQTLYQLDTQRAETTEHAGWLVQALLEESGLSGDPAEYAWRLVQGVWAKRAQYDEMIAGASRHWEVARMVVVDRNILRLALYELIEQPDVPVRVVIDEAIELGREFGGEETPQFINGVLDAIYKTHPTCQIARGDVSG
jgi:N utilization substance protein B